MRSIGFAAFAAIAAVISSIANATESPVAITEAQIVGELGMQYSAGSILFPGAKPGNGMKNDNLFRGPMKSVGLQIVTDVSTLPQESLDKTVRNYLRSKWSDSKRLNAALLNDPRSGFVLTGIVNRMDRAYRVVDGHRKIHTCGEIRFLYRFTYDVDIGGKIVASRLPITMAIVLDAKRRTDKISCGEIARRWLAIPSYEDGARLLDYLRSPNGPLAYLRPTQVDRIEMNVQMFRAPAGIKTDFGGHAEYLLRVFRRKDPKSPFVATRLENQIDRGKLLGDADEMKAFRKWLFSSAAMSDLDSGTIDIPFRWLTDHAISVSPGGADRSINQPFLGLLDEDEIEKALTSYAANIEPPKTIRSPAGFVRRLNEVTCNGCHQIRAIAGFHFPGADPPSEAPANAVHVPGSAHFNGDLPRRIAVLSRFAVGKSPDFSRGFSSRPDEVYASVLQGTQIVDGWGAPCYVGNDRSFASWTCRSGLACKSLNEAPSTLGMGVCVTADIARIGDPVEFGTVAFKNYGNDSYRRDLPPGPSMPENYEVPPAPKGRNDYVVSHQGYKASDLTGGFPGGMLRIDGCSKLPLEAICGRVAVDGFNDCVARGKPFTACLQYTKEAGLRACDADNPCRQDYICTAPYRKEERKGTCIPPYFMFQFRVDGHPSAFVSQEAVNE